MATRRKRNQLSQFSENKVTFIRGGSQYFEVLHDMIRNAQNTIHLQTYIYDDDHTGQQVADALINAAKRNVQIFILVDGYASQDLPESFINTIKEAGIRFRFFEPLLRSRNFYFGRRLHNKVVVVDTKCTLVGGVNISDRYNDLPGAPAWLDFALYSEGPIARDICMLCLKNWKGFSRKVQASSCEQQEFGFKKGSAEMSLVRLRLNDWLRNKMQITNSYLEMFRTATSHITILSSYALPGNFIRKNLEKAVKRGVKVKMIISGHSDVMLVKHAERYWYDWLMRNNIEIYEYTRNVLHGKMAVCDSEWMTVGSYNVNDLSAYASIELNLDVHNPRFIKKAESILQEIIDRDCILISKESHAKSRNMVKRLGQWFSYNIIRLTFTLFTFYYRRQK